MRSPFCSWRNKLGVEYSVYQIREINQTNLSCSRSCFSSYLFASYTKRFSLEKLLVVSVASVLGASDQVLRIGRTLAWRTASAVTAPARLGMDTPRQQYHRRDGPGAKQHGRSRSP